jgi:UDP-N-acetyl-D-glucosamine dehydrogenase
MPHFCVEKVTRALNEHAKPVRGSRVAVMGVSYKPGVGDLRESPLRIIRLLREQGAEVGSHDPYVPDLADLGLRSEWPHGADCVVIVTAHPGLDLERLVRESPLLVDFRGVARGVRARQLVRL